ncbi:hypothetical protein J4Q44_G00271280 [Coregonus suidteri]|uniref:Uncharacterized protein n=1 Tax=Coregonus suidteri TaxID=861788 RepID=A0AAN8L2Y0_9TELE
MSNTMSLASISILFGQMVRGLSSGTSVFEYLSFEPTIPRSGGGRIPYKSLTGWLDFMNITFRQDHQWCDHVGRLAIRTLDPSWPRGQVIGLINQEPVLFGSSVMENICFGKRGLLMLRSSTLPSRLTTNTSSQAFQMDTTLWLAGTHMELLSKGGLYADLIRRQRSEGQK